MKINIGSIEGYENMTPEEKLATLEGYEIPDPDYSDYVKKELYDKAASETASWKRKYNETATDEAKKQDEREQEMQTLRDAIAERDAKITAIEKDLKIRDNKAKFLALGYEEKQADDAAKAMADGNMEKVFSIQQKFQESYAKKVEEDLMNKTMKPGGAGANDKPMTKEEIYKILDPTARQEAIAANIGLFDGGK